MQDFANSKSIVTIQQKLELYTFWAPARFIPHIFFAAGW